MEHAPSAPQKPKSAEVNPGPGFRIRKSFERLDGAFIRRFDQFQSPDISDQTNRLYALAPDICCLNGDHHQIVGPACTVKVFPGDNLMVHASLDVAQPGDIVVIDAGGSRMNAALGELISTKAMYRGIAGFVVDGYIRDLPEIPPQFPVFARGTTPIGPLHRGPGEINYPICCGGVVVHPGDIIVGDAFGVVVIPRENAEEILERLVAYKSKMEDYIAQVKRGEFSNAWVDAVLAESGCIITP